MGSGCLSVIFTLALVFGVAVTSTDASAVGKARPRPRNEPGYHMPPVDEEKTQADSLNSHWDYLIDKLSSNSDTPSQLVIDLVSLSLTQLDIYGFVKEKSTRTAMLKMKIANNTYVVLELVIDNFKKGLRALMSEMSKGSSVSWIEQSGILTLRTYCNSESCIIAHATDTTLCRLARRSEAYPASLTSGGCLSKDFLRLIPW